MSVNTIELGSVTRKHRWIFSKRIDLLLFTFPVFLALTLCACCRFVFGVQGEAMPLWFWVGVALCLDATHVYATIFRVYLDPQELRRRRMLYISLPLLTGVALVVLSLCGELVFWRALTYLAIFHTVRQQAGWLNIYRRRNNETNQSQIYIDQAALYLSVLYPVIWWHAHTPLTFDWFFHGDFVYCPTWVERLTFLATTLSLTLYALHALLRYTKATGTPGKDLLVLTTFLTWQAGIIWADGDYMFTAFSILPHSIPYIALNIAYLTHRSKAADKPWLISRLALSPLLAIMLLVCLGYIEELGWDHFVWHERPILFGFSTGMSPKLTLIAAAILSVPQVVHYVLDGFIWRGKSNPSVNGLFGPDAFSQLGIQPNLSSQKEKND